MSKFNIKRIINSTLENFGYEIKKCQVKDQNRYRWLEEYAINTIFDIGANVGDWAAELNHHFPNARIYAFEPLPDCFEQLEKVSREIPQIQAFNAGLGEESGSFQIFRSSQASSSSLLKMGDLHKAAFPHTSELTEEHIEVRTLNEVAEELELQDNIFIKLDVQGFEMKVIAGGEKLIRRAKVLLVETSFQTLYEGQPLFDEVYDRLTGMGFKYMGDFESIKSPLNGAVLQGNAIFVGSD